jgi:ankyrin repeat protein
MASTEGQMGGTEELSPELVKEFVLSGHGNFGRIKELLAQHPALLNVSAPWDETALGAAAHTGQVEIAEFLLAAGAPLDICTAAMLGRRDEVGAMLRADPGLAHATGAHGFPVLFYPALRGDIETAALLLAAGADVNAGGDGVNTALHAAAGFDQPAMATWLLERGARHDARGFQEKTPLAMAESLGYAEVAAVLRQAGATL